MKKTIFIMSLVFVLGFALAGCDQKTTQPTQEKELEKQQEVVDAKQAIQQLLADKYGKYVDEVTIDIELETQDHVRGYATYAPGGPENIKLFLAAKQDNAWQLFFDGDGSPLCQELDVYNFPEAMQQGCQGDQSATTQTETTQMTKEVANGQEFDINLESNATTGYKWEVVYDQTYVELTNQEYIAPEGQDIVGAPGQEKFEFKALQEGDTQITFSYSKPWEQDVDPIKKAVYNVVIE